MRRRCPGAARFRFDPKRRHRRCSHRIEPVRYWRDQRKDHRNGPSFASERGRNHRCQRSSHPARGDRHASALPRAGLTHKEDLETGSRAAVLGGVTAVFEMPNTGPPTVSAGALADKMTRAKGRMHCDYAFWVGGTAENWRDIPELERLPGCAGIKVFVGSSTGSLLVADDEGIARILGQTRRRAAFHSEDEFRLAEREGLRVANDASSHPLWRDEMAAVQSTARLVRIARKKRALIHILHVSCAEELEIIAANKDLASAEVTPHHLTLSADDYARLGTKLHMNPPVREARHR